jgi:hypothetical protein
MKGVGGTRPPLILNMTDDPFRGVNLNQSGVPSVALNEFNRMVKSPTFAPPEQFVDALVELQKEMIRSRNEQANTTALLMQMVENQAAALKEHMVGVQTQLIKADEDNQRRLQETLDEIREYQSRQSPLTREEKKNELMEKMRQRQLQEGERMRQESEIVAHTLKTQQHVPYYIKEGATFTTSGVKTYYPKGVNEIPIDLALRLAEAEMESEHLERLKSTISTDRDELIKMGQNPLAIYAIDEALRHQR